MIECGATEIVLTGSPPPLLAIPIGGGICPAAFQQEIFPYGFFVVAIPRTHPGLRLLELGRGHPGSALASHSGCYRRQGAPTILRVDGDNAFNAAAYQLVGVAGIHARDRDSGPRRSTRLTRAFRPES